ncbi:hypothetical protein PAXRUDRAFT_800503, partial [Paxillus rubicundulus Ve08.2h10]
ILCNLQFMALAASVNPPPVVKMVAPTQGFVLPGAFVPASGPSGPHCSASMQLPQLPQLPQMPQMPQLPQMHRSPNIHVPSAWNKPHGDAHPIIPPSLTPAFSPAVGYRSQHALYPSENEHWASLVHHPPPVATISLDVSAVYEGGPRKGRQHGTPFGSICEGKKGVDACITAPQLVTPTLQTIVPRIQTFCPEYTWHTAEFFVHDAGWVDLSNHLEPFQPYFYQECLQPGTQKNSRTMIFKSKQFSLFVVVPQSQWLEYKDSAKRKESTAAS